VELDFSRGRFRVRGFVGLPESARPSPKYFVTFVNGRLVRDRVVRAGVLQGYAGLLLKGLLPSAVLFIEVDPSWVDVNVHPAKTELRFLDGGAVQDLITIGVQNAVKGAAQSRSAPLPVQVLTPQPVFSSPSRGWEPPVRSASQSSVAPIPSVTRGTFVSAAEPSAPVPVPTTTPLFESLAGPFAGATFLGQYKNCYLLIECAGELWVVDQHAFHERILYEEILRDSRRQGRIPSQELLSPIVVPLPRGTESVVEEAAPTLLDIGFRIEVLVSGDVAIHAYPAMMGTERITRAFDDILARIFARAGLSNSDAHPLLLKAAELRNESFGDEASLSRLDGEAVHHLFFATMACHSAVRAGEPLAAEQVRRLLSRAGDVDFFANCPHGRPVVRKFSEADVQAWFARI
jgi:DNA mismatch repair protein MutL